MSDSPISLLSMFEMGEFVAPTREEVIKRSTDSPTAFENWIGAVEESGANSPASLVLPLSLSIQDMFMDGGAMAPNDADHLSDLCRQIKDFGAEHGFPLFIKTSFTSAKHYWKETCLLPEADVTPDNLLNHIFQLCLYQSMSPNVYTPSLIVRKMIDVEPIFTAFSGKMPITEEFRVFSTDGVMNGYQPYWPERSIEGQNPSVDNWREKLASISEPSSENLDDMGHISSLVTKKLGGYWSIDFLKDRDGKLWVIDLAEGNLSFKCKDGYKSTCE